MGRKVLKLQSMIKLFGQFQNITKQFFQISADINMYRHIREGIELSRSFDIRTQYEIEDAKETAHYGFGLDKMF